MQAREADLDPLVHGARDAVGVERREGVQCRVHVPGQVDLGNDDDAAQRRVGLDHRVVLGRVPAARVAVDGGVARAGGELRVRREVQPPALVVGEVQVQDVQPEVRHDFQEREHGRHGVEVPRDVDGQTAPGEAGGVLDPRRRDGGGVRVGELEQGGDPVVQAAEVRCGERDRVRRHVQHVAAGFGAAPRVRVEP